MHATGDVCARTGGNSYHPVPYRYNSLDPAHLMHTPGNWYLLSGQQSEYYTVLCGSSDTQSSKLKAVSNVIAQPFLSNSVEKTEVTTIQF